MKSIIAISIFVVLISFSFVSASNIILDPSFELNNDTWVNTSTNGGMANQSSTAYNQSGNASGMTSTVSSNGTSTALLTQSINQLVTSFNFSNSLSWWALWQANATNGTTNCYTSFTSNSIPPHSLIYWYNLNRAPPSNSSSNVYLTITNPTYQTWNQTQRNFWADWNVTAGFPNTDNITNIQAACEGNYTADSCAGTLTCSATILKPDCAGCNQCLFSFMNCSGTKDCSVWNNNESGCMGVPGGQCMWIDPNCVNGPADCINYASESDCDYMNVAGCNTNGDCNDNGACSSVATQSMCETSPPSGCGGALGCTTWTATSTFGQQFFWDTFNLIDDTSAPNVEIVSPANQTVSSDYGLWVNFTTYDASGISACWWSDDFGVTNISNPSCDNLTGTWVYGLNIVRVYANDTLGKQNMSEIYFYIDANSPTFSSDSRNTSQPGEATKFSVLVNDSDLDLETNGQYIFSFDNCTGSFVNDSAVNFSSSPQWVNVTKVTNSTKDCSIRWQVYASDNYGRMNASEIYTYNTDDFEELWGCNDLGVSQTYRIMQNLSAPGYCLRINADDITLDCNGFAIKFSETDPGYGIDVEADRFSMGSCKIEEINPIENSYGVYIADTSDDARLTSGVPTYISVTGNNSRGIEILGQNAYVSFVLATVSGDNSKALSILGATNTTIRISNFYSSGNNSRPCYLEGAIEPSIFAGYCMAVGDEEYYADNSYALHLLNTHDGYFNVTTVRLSGVDSSVAKLEGSYNNTFERIIFESTAPVDQSDYELILDGSYNNTFLSCGLKTNMSENVAYLGDLIMTNSVNNNFSNLSILSNDDSPNTRISFDQYSGNILLNNSAMLGTAPPGQNDMENFINLTSTGWVYLKMLYTHDDLVTYNINESSIRLRRYNSTGWLDYGFYPTGQYGIRPVQNYAFANITSFSPFALFGEGGYALANPILTFVPPTPDNGELILVNYANINITSDMDLNNASLEWNDGLSTVNYTMSAYNSLNWYLLKSSLVLGTTYTYTVYGQSLENLTHWSVSETRNFTYIDDTTPPVVTLISPDDNHFRNSVSGFSFACNNTDNIQLANSTLYGTWNGGWHANSTDTISGTVDLATFPYSATEIEEGTFVWNCYTCDTSGNCDWGTSNRTLTNDYTDPVITLYSPEDGASYPEGYVPFILKCSDGLTNPETLQLWSNSGGWQASRTNSSPINDTNWTISDFSFESGTYTFGGWCNDSAGNSLFTDNRTFYVNDTNLEGCIEIDNPGVYTLIEDLTTTDSCIIIKTSDVVLDCDTHSITGDRGTLDYGVSTLFERYSRNVTVKNCRINDFDIGISFLNSWESIIDNNTVWDYRSYGITFQFGNSSNITNNVVYNDNLNVGDCLSIKGAGGNLNLVDNLDCKNSFYGISIEGGDNNTLKNSRMNTTGIGVQVSSAVGTITDNISIINSSFYGVHVVLVSTSNFMSNISYLDNALDIQLETNGLANNQFITNNFSGTIFSFNYYNQAKINYSISPPSNPDYISLNKYINLENDSSNTWINLSLHYEDSDWQNLGIYNESTLKIMEYNGTNWVDVSSTVDTVNNLVFANITSFSDYGLFGKDDIILTECGELNITNGNYFLTGTVSSAGTCFTIKADNVSLNCQDEKISYSNSEVGYGILDEDGYENTLIQNCLIDTGSNQINSHGIKLMSSYNNNISNNEFVIDGAQSNGLRLYSVTYSNIENNNILIPIETAYGIYLEGCSSNNFTNNILNITNDTSNGYFVFSSSNDNLFINDSIYNQGNLAFHSFSTQVGNITFMSLFNPNDYSIFTKFNMSFTGRPTINWSDAPASDPTDFKNISKYMYLTGDGSFDDLFMFYDDSNFIDTCQGGTPNCGAIVGSKPTCTACNQCSFSFSTCAGDPLLACGVFLNAEDCGGAAPVCSWDGFICQTVSNCAAASETVCDYLENNSAGCFTDGTCGTLPSAQCQATGSQSMCESSCGGPIGCSTWNDGLDINESKLLMLRYNTTEWIPLETSYVDIINNFVFFDLKTVTGETSYYALMEDNRTGGASVNAPTNLNIYLREDNQTTMINWTAVSGADGYYIYFSDNLTELLQANETTIWSENASLVGENNITYNDTTANESTRRFYRVSAYLGALTNLSNVSETVGKYTITITSGGVDKESTFSYPLQENKTLEQAISLPPNTFSTVMTFNGTDWLWAYWNGISWVKSGFSYINFSEGYYTFAFNSQMNMTNVGKVPFGNTTRTITSGGVDKESTFGWESITDGQTIENILPLPPNTFSTVMTFNGTDWLWDYWNGISWVKGSGFNTFEPSKGYYSFAFNSPMNLNYTRNNY